MREPTAACAAEMHPWLDSYCADANNCKLDWLGQLEGKQKYLGLTHSSCITKGIEEQSGYGYEEQRQDSWLP